VNQRLSLDFTGFVSFYRRLQTAEPATPFVTINGGVPLLVIPLLVGNEAHARDHGVEVFANWKVTNRWKISPGYSLLRMSVEPDPSSQDTLIGQTAGNSPKQQFQIRSMLTLRRNLEWDSSLKYVAGLDGINIPGYARLDTRLGWHLGDSMEVSVSGQNLAKGRHVEFFDASGLFVQTEVARSVFGKVSWRF